MKLNFHRTIYALCDFFLREIPRLSETYDWKIPIIPGFPQSGHVGYQPNLNLKAHFKKQWEEGSNDDRLGIAKVIVSDWGGVHANRTETLERYVRSILETEEPPTPLKGVASYSKIFAVVDPARFAIYDARVAACLNAVQINAGVEQGLAFNYVPGRNNIVGNSVSKQGFTQDPRFSPKKLVDSGWLPVKRSETYKQYLDVLKLCQAELESFSLVSLEMALFANAESECLHVIQQHSNQ
ncbi:hypothetical protein [Comamonas terrigena]|jgi:hypothetical protein|uniref:hypothetical protein n=1 Tax=Comamonas terrigena TaxID=32013 RepID=UPI002449CB03|nr:hypothetical protein [Comamonas terrigena]MDH1503406.1 hypothetical protein [Comamonas terrigena]